MRPLRPAHFLWRGLTLTFFIGGPVASVASSNEEDDGGGGGILGRLSSSIRQLAQNKQQPHNFVNDVNHCTNPQMINSIEPDVFCNPANFQWDLTVLDPSAPPNICVGVNYTEIYDLSFAQAALTDLQKPCYWWNLMYGSMAPSSTPSTSAPSVSPSLHPSLSPSSSPSMQPTTLTPSVPPTTLTPSKLPSTSPTKSPTMFPSSIPSNVPTAGTVAPSHIPTLLPTKKLASPLPSEARAAAPVSAPIQTFRRPTLKPTAPPTFVSTVVESTTVYPTMSMAPSAITPVPTPGSTLDRSGNITVRPLANFVVAYYVSSSNSDHAGGSVRRRQEQLLRVQQHRQLLSVNRYQLTSITATYLVEQLKADFPNSHVRTVALVLTSVSAEVSVDHNTTSNTSSSSSTFQEVLSGEVIFGTTNASVVPIVTDLYGSIQSAFTNPTSLKSYFKLLQSSKDPVLKRIGRVNLIQGAIAISNVTDSSQNNTASSATGGGSSSGIQWNTGLIAVVAGAGVLTILVAIALYLCITHKSRRRRRRLRQQQQRKDKDAQSAKSSESQKSKRGNSSRAALAVDTKPPQDASSVASSGKGRRWFSWGGDRSSAVPDLTLQPTASVNSSPLSLITTPRSNKSDSPLKAAVAASGVAAAVATHKRRKVDDFDELITGDDDDEDCFRSAADEEEHSEVTSTYSYIETNTNDEHSISVAPSFLYGANETGSIIGEYDDFGELVSGATSRIHRTAWIDDLSLPSKTASWTALGANSKRIPKPPPIPPPPRARASSLPPAPRPPPIPPPPVQDPDNSHLLNISGSYASFYEYDEKKGIMIMTNPAALGGTGNADDEDDMPSKIGGSFLLEESFLTQEGSQTDGLPVVVDNKGKSTILDSPGRLPGMDSGSLFLNSPSTSLSSNNFSPQKGQVVPARILKPPAPVDDHAMGDVLQFYEGTTSATTVSSYSSTSPVKGKKFAFDEVWRDIVEEDVDDHVRDTMSVASGAASSHHGRSPASHRKDSVSNRITPPSSLGHPELDVNASLERLNRSDASMRMAPSPQGSRKVASSGSPNNDALDTSVNSLNSLERLNRSDASMRMAMTPTGSRRTTTSGIPSSDAMDSSSKLVLSPEKLNRSDASLRMALTPTGSRRIASSASPNNAADNNNNSSAHINSPDKLNRSDASLRMAMIPSGSQKIESTQATATSDAAAGDLHNSSIHSTDRLNRSDASLRMAVVPTGSQREAAAVAASNVVVDDAQQDLGADSAASSTEQVHQAAEATRRNQEIAAKRWLANRANDNKKSDVAAKQVRSRSVAPAAGQRGAAAAAATTTSAAATSKRSASLPPSRHGTLHRVTEDLPFDEEGVSKPAWSPRERKIAEVAVSDDDEDGELGSKFSV